MDELYRPEFVATYRQFNSDLPIETWKEVIGKHLPMFASDNQIYQPAEVRIKLTRPLTDPTGTVKIEVALSDANWYDKLLGAVGEMVQRPAGQIEIVDDCGAYIDKLNQGQLSRAGDLCVIDAKSRKPVYVAAVTAPPKHMSADKEQDIMEWLHTKRQAIADVVVNELKDKHDMIAISTAVCKDGAVQHALATYFINSRPNGESWGQFLQTYAESDAVRALDPKDVAKQLARSFLVEVRKSLRASQNEIKAFYSNQQQKQQGKDGDEAKLWDDHIRAAIGAETHYESALDMFNDVVDEAVHRPVLEAKVYYVVNQGQNLIAGHNNGKWGYGKKKKKKKKHKSAKARVLSSYYATPVSAKTDTHPNDTYYHEVHYKQHGKLPGHVVRSFNKDFQAKSTKRVFPGDPIRAFALYHLFCGRAVLPPATPKAMPRLERIPNSHHEEDRLPFLVRADVEGAGDTIRMKNEFGRGKSINIGGCVGRLVPIDARPMPRLERIADQDNYAKDDKDEEDEEEEEEEDEEGEVGDEYSYYIEEDVNPYGDVIGDSLFSDEYFELDDNEGSDVFIDTLPKF